MDSVPLIPKAKVLPNLDSAPLLRELFQDEFQAVLPTKKLSQNILTSVQYQKYNEDDKETYKSVEFLEGLTNRKDNVIDFTENVLEAYTEHQRNVDEIRDVEKHIFETHAQFLNREVTFFENKAVCDLVSLKRQPLFKSLDVNYVKKYKLLQGEAGLPLEYEIHSDFRVKNFKIWKKKLETLPPETVVFGYLNEAPVAPKECKLPRRSALPVDSKKVQKPRPKKEKVKQQPEGTFRAEPKIVFFTGYKVGDVYAAEITIKNVHTKGVQFQVKPTSPDGPFKVIVNDKTTTKLFSGLSLQLLVEFTPRSLDNAAEDVVIVTEDGNRLLIPLIAYLEAPILKTHKDVDEFTKVSAERIASSYIECGTCFSGDTKVTKLRFRCYRGSGEFFIMSSENWSRSCVNSVTVDNLLEIPPFQVYPVYFKMEKDEVIDLFVEFNPKNSGMHVENVVIACDNGEIRFLDLLGDAVGWHSYYFSFQDSLLKTLPAEQDDDMKVKHYLDFEDCTRTGRVEKAFCVCNNSNMAFEFQWKIREANIHGQEKYMKLSRFEVKIDPESGTFEANSMSEFVVTISLENAEIGNYRMVLSLYVLNLPYQCIEEDNTIIQPTGLVRNLYSQSLYGEEEGPIISPELTSLQGTYESLQESIKSYVECQTKAQTTVKNDFCRTVCIPNPGLCAKPLKKSKTFFNIGDSNLEDDGLTCGCRMKPAEAESNSESCTSNTRDERLNEVTPQRNEVIWDFVDVLVDEIELGLEVVPTRVTLEPGLLHLGDSLKVYNDTVCKTVRIVNHNHSPVTCTWVRASKTREAETGGPDKTETSLSVIFDKNFGKRESANPVNRIEKDSSGGKEEETSEENFELEREFDEEGSELCRITIKPQKRFSLAGCSEQICEIGVTACQWGEIRETLCLSVNQGDLQLKLLIVGSTLAESFQISPEILNFGPVKQGTRYSKEFKIINSDENPLFWKVIQYKLDLNGGKFLSFFQTGNSSGVKRAEGVLQSKETVERFYLDARVPGFKCFLLKVEGKKKKNDNAMAQFIFVLAYVSEPKVLLSTSRMKSAILSPAGPLYVGQKIVTEVKLHNVGPVNTFCTWGNPFGCHSRKIKVDISPKSFQINKKKKLSVTLEVTGLEEGIINHCYIPCFFCRSADPLILSVVTLVENIKVTFEILDSPPMQTNAGFNSVPKDSFYQTVLRVPWPIKIYNPTLNKKFIREIDLINMKCHCLEVEEEANKAFGDHKQETVPELAASAKSVQSLLSFEISDENSLKSKSSVKKNNKSGYDDDLKLSTSALSGYEESKKSEENSLTVSTYRDTSSETLRLVKSELEFLNVPFRTPIQKKFVIRNETPIHTRFQISVLNYGVSKALTISRVEAIKNKVLGRNGGDEFRNKLTKDRPLVIDVQPSQGELGAYEAVCINAFCYGNTWGEYRDFLICHIQGIESFHLKVYIQIVGHPIYFPMFANQSAVKPILLFQPLSHVENPASKQIKVVNRSAIPLTVSWIVFLTKPLPLEEEQQEENVNTSIESCHSVEDSLKSSMNYIPKNTSGSASTFGKQLEMMDSSQNSRVKSFEITNPSSGQKERKDFGPFDKKFSIPSITDKGKSNSLPGRPDSQIFQVDPKRADFEPFEEKKMTITFDPHFCNPEVISQEFQGVLTACVKLKPEDEKCPGVYYRPCGMNFVSELMDFNALVETPLASFDILRGDLKFIMDSNAIIKSAPKETTIRRKFLIKNKNQKTLRLKIEIVPGVLFQITNVHTIDKFYPKYNPNDHILKIEPGHLLEMELQCSVSHKDVMYAFEQLKLNRIKNECHVSSDDVKAFKQKIPEDNKDDYKQRSLYQPWKQHFNCHCTRRSDTDRQSLSHRDSFELNLNRMSSKSDNSICYDLYGRSSNEEIEGEELELPEAEESPSKPKAPQNETVIEEEISFIQSGLVTQTLTAELHLSFPMIKISPSSLDFGKVYLGETAVRYCSLINLSGFPTDFRVKAKCKASEFTANPLTGSLPPTNYNADLGRTLTIQFKPPQPGYFKETFHVYCNQDMLFEFFELFVSGFGTWNEKYRTPKMETYIKLQGIYPKLQK